MTDEHIWRSDCCGAKELVEFVGDATRRSWKRSRVAPSEAGAIVAARPRMASDSGLHETPAQRRTAKRRIEDHRRAALAVTPDVQPVIPEAYQPSGRPG